MKKLICLILVLLNCTGFVLSAVGCNNKQSNNQIDSGGSSEPEAPDTNPDPDSNPDPTPDPMPDPTPDPVPDPEEIIYEIAYAYDRQAGQILYDQYNSRRSMYSTPEDATAQRTFFLDCSSFVNSIYREGYGENVMPYELREKSCSTVYYDEYCRDNLSNEDVVGYWVATDYTTDEQRNEVANWIIDNLQVGDVLVYRHGTSQKIKGHCYIYIKDGVFMHCAGAGSYSVNSANPALSYDSNAKEVTDGGTIGVISPSKILKSTSSSRYLFKSTESDTVFSFGIIRPLARGLTPTEKTLNRMKIAGLSMEKTSSVWENNSVKTNDLITYTVAVRNTKNNNMPITITDVVPEGTEFVSGDEGVVCSNGAITWSGNAARLSTIYVSYTVKITAGSPGALIVSDKTAVSGVTLGRITHSVSSFTEEESAYLAKEAIGYADNALAFDDTVAMIKALYESFGITLFDCNTASEILDQIIDAQNLKKRIDTELAGLVAPNLYGGLDIRTGWTYLPSENDKTRLPMEEHLSVGDIIVADWSEGSDVYLYAGNHTLITVKDGICVALTIGESIYTAGENIIISLLGYNRYAVIRPSMSDGKMTIQEKAI